MHPKISFASPSSPVSWERVECYTREKIFLTGDFEVPREPLTERRLLFGRHIQILVDIRPIASAYLFFLLSAIFPDALSNAQ